MSRINLERTHPIALQKFKDTMSGSEILILENSYEHPEDIKIFINSLEGLGKKPSVKTLFGLQDIAVEKVFRDIGEAEIIVFQTTWITERSNVIKNFVEENNSHLKAVVEVCLDEPLHIFNKYNFEIFNFTNSLGDVKIDFLRKDKAP